VRLIVHWASGALLFTSPVLGIAGGTIRYQPTSASAAAWRGFILPCRDKADLKFGEESAAIDP
jgi:hypothetical protein